MKTIKIYSGILLFSFIFLLNGVFAQKAPYGIALNKNKRIFLDKTEVTVFEWFVYYGYIADKFGENSLEAHKALPDTALFRQIYDVSLFLLAGSNQKPILYIRLQDYKRPITCISYQQALDYCQWRADRVNERWKLKKKPYYIIYTLPSKEDYDKAMQKAIISQNQPLSPVIAKRKFTGLTDNVVEYTQDKDTIIAGGNINTMEIADNPSQPTGFRCKAFVKRHYSYPITPVF